MIGGGPDIARQYLAAGAVDELRLHLVPLLLGAGTRLFDFAATPNVILRPTATVDSPLATHLHYTVEPATAGAPAGA